MQAADRRLREAGLVEVEHGEDGWFGDAKMHKGMIGDDHLPVGLALKLDKGRVLI